MYKSAKKEFSFLKEISEAQQIQELVNKCRYIADRSDMSAYKNNPDLEQKEVMEIIEHVMNELNIPNKKTRRLKWKIIVKPKSKGYFLVGIIIASWILQKRGFEPSIQIPPPPPLEIWSEIKTGTQKAAASGYFLIINDLPEDKHVLNLKVLDLLAGNEGPPSKFEPLRTGSYEIFVK